MEKPKTCPDCGAKLDAFGYCPFVPVELSIRGLQYCGRDERDGYVKPHPDGCSCDRCRLTRQILAA
jgi:hypothetical protein